MNPPIFGIVGGIGSGKSTVAARLVDRGAILIDADRLGHRVLREPDVVAALTSRWGDTILRDHEIDRSQVARIVFSPTETAIEERRWLESVTHPRIASHIHEQILRAQTAKPPAIVLDAPLLLEGGWDRFCDAIVFVDASESVRQKRVQARGWNDDERRRRERNQWPLPSKRAASQIVLPNDGEEAELDRQIDIIWKQVVSPDILSAARPAETPR